MNPVDILRDYMDRNPQGGSLILGAVACFAAVAIVALFGLDLEASIPAVTYVLGIGVLVCVLTAVVSDRFVMSVLKWFAVLILVSWFFAFTAHRVFPDSEIFSCAARFWEPCRVVADKSAIPGVAPAEGQLQPGTSPEAASPDPQIVYVMFAGFPRDTIRDMMKGLAATGWQVQGVEGGGRRHASADKIAEVRYRGSSDKNAAERLAQAVNGMSISQRTVAATQNSLITEGTLEVWISP